MSDKKMKMHDLVREIVDHVGIDDVGALKQWLESTGAELHEGLVKVAVLLDYPKCTDWLLDQLAVMGKEPSLSLIKSALSIHEQTASGRGALIQKILEKRGLAVNVEWLEKSNSDHLKLWLYKTFAWPLNPADCQEVLDRENFAAIDQLMIQLGKQLGGLNVKNLNAFGLKELDLFNEKRSTDFLLRLAKHIDVKEYGQMYLLHCLRKEQIDERVWALIQVSMDAGALDFGKHKIVYGHLRFMFSKNFDILAKDSKKMVALLDYIVESQQVKEMLTWKLVKPVDWGLFLGKVHNQTSLLNQIAEFKQAQGERKKYGTGTFGTYEVAKEWIGYQEAMSEHGKLAKVVDENASKNAKNIINKIPAVDVKAKKHSL